MTENHFIIFSTHFKYFKFQAGTLQLNSLLRWSNSFKFVYTTFCLDTKILFSLFSFLFFFCCFSRFTWSRSEKPVLILEEFEWNWGKFHWNLRLFYITQKISRILFLNNKNYNNTEFFSQSCVDRYPHHHEKRFLLLYDAIFKFSSSLLAFFLCCFCSLSAHTQRRLSSHRQHTDHDHDFLLRGDFFSSFFFPLQREKRTFGRLGFMMIKENS